MKTSSLTPWLVYAGLFVAAAAARLLPHPADFTPVGAVMLFGGFYFSQFSRRFGWLAFLPVLVASDAMLGFYDWRLMLAVYGSFLLMALWGAGLRGNYSFRGAILRVVAGSATFFMTTNLAVWALSSWYPHTLSGLMACYALALPFFRASLSGDLLFGAAVFGAYSLAHYGILRKTSTHLAHAYRIF